MFMTRRGMRAPVSRSFFTIIGSLHLPRFQSQSNNARVQPDRVFVASVPIAVGPAREVAIRIRVLLDGFYDCFQLRDRDAAVLRRGNGRGRAFAPGPRRGRDLPRWVTAT